MERGEHRSRDLFWRTRGLDDVGLEGSEVGVPGVRFRAMFGIPEDVAFHFCVPLGYPEGNFGPNVRKPTSETTFLNRWGAPVPWGVIVDR